MKILDLASVTDSAQMPLKQGTLKFLQDANYEAFGAIVMGLIGPGYNPGSVYLLNGCLNTGNGLNYSFGAGAIFYNGEIFLVDAASFTTTTNQVPIFQISVSQYTVNADPVRFTDRTMHNIHNIRKISISAGVSQSGLADFGQVITLSFIVPQPIKFTGTGITGAYPNFDVPGASGKNPVLHADTFNIGDVNASGVSDFNVVFTDLGTASYFVMGTIISNGTPTADTSFMWTIRNRTNVGFTIHCREVTSDVQNVTFEYILFAKP